MSLARPARLWLALVAFSPAFAAGPSDPDAPLRASGISLVEQSGRVELLRPGKPEYQSAEELPLPLGVGMQLKTGTLGRAVLEYEDGGVVRLSANSEVKISNPACELAQGRLRAAAPPRLVVGVETAAVPVRIEGRSFSVDMPGKGRGQMAALGNGRPIAAKLVAAKGFVEVQLPFGKVRAQELPLTLHEGSVVQTNANSFALIVFPDGSRMKLRADSTVSVDNVNQCTIAAGAADVQVSEMGKLEMRTINRPALIRGPAFFVEVHDEKPEKEQPAAEEPAMFQRPSPKPAPAPDAAIPGGMGWDTSGG